tara:strand:- start:2508 stop:3116 length:609 start_codon:yes stop_codon:yes gene_type:complete
MKLIREYYELCEGGVCQDLLSESEKAAVAAGKEMYLTGLMQEADKPNGNNRIYEKKTLVREVKNYRKLVEENRALGELDHPDNNIIELKNVSHCVTDIWMEGNKVMGKIKVLQETPMGAILAGLIKEGVKLGISSRGQGSVHESGGRTIVEDDFQLICFDIVSDPSTAGAFMMTEAKDPSKAFSSVDRIDRQLNHVLEKFGK